MAGGPIFPCSAVPITLGKVFPVILTTTHPEGLGWMASLDGDAIWRLFYRMPPTLPSGTGKFLMLCQANATSGNAKLNVKWKSYGENEVPAAGELTAEGVATIGFSTAAYRLVETKITLDADTLVGGEMVMVDLTGETASWTLAQVLSVQAAIIWE